ncbi:MAG: hypothetical protein L6R43_12360 [Planctomycetes bacterium]|nr:hypothetical protein [Planctomycetota bacterium]
MERSEEEDPWKRFAAWTGGDPLATLVAVAAFVFFVLEERSGGLLPAGMVVGGWLIHRGLLRR